MKTYAIFCGGSFIETNTELSVSNPFSGEIFAKTFLAESSHLETAIKAAQAANAEMKTMPSFRKYKILTEIATKISEKKTYLATILSLECAKPMRYALGEIDRAIQTFVVAAEESKRIPAEVISLDWTAAGSGKEGKIKYFPVGLVAAIAPFNFPLNLAVHKLAPAIAAGNTIILKPARSTPLSVLELAKIISETDLPKGAVSILPMDRIAGNQLVTDKRFKLLTFTGSPEVGWQMKKNCGNKRIVLELGGNAGAAITESADLENAVNKCVTGAFAYSGQVCIHLQRIYVHSSVFEEFSQKFIEKTKTLKTGNPLELDTDISAMIDEENAIRVENWVNEAVAQGAKLLHGGKRTQTYFEPTVLTQTHNTMKVCALEIFGPVVTLEKYDNFSDVLQQINGSNYGLQAGIFTNKISEMDMAFNELEVGGVIINDVPTFRVDHMPYGGVKNSGLGREGVKYAIAEMMEPKLLVK